MVPSCVGSSPTDGGSPHSSAATKTPQRCRHSGHIRCGATSAISTRCGAAWTGCYVVYHASGVNAFCLRDPSEMMRVNVEGSLNVVRAAAAAGIDRVVYTSSAAAIGEAAGTVGSESSPHRGTYHTWYERSKHEAEVAVLAEADRFGVELVSVNPSSVQGPGPAQRHRPHPDRLPQREAAVRRGHDAVHRVHRRLRGRPPPRREAGAWQGSAICSTGRCSRSARPSSSWRRSAGSGTGSATCQPWTARAAGTLVGGVSRLLRQETAAVLSGDGGGAGPRPHL